MNRIRYLLAGIVMLTTTAYAQNAILKMQNYHPVSPSAFQFLKYDEMPVSEYTGVPNISIPLYNIEEDGVNIPINLTYHSGGIRVNQEASWVGLGWDLNFGSIVQEINDVDDYATYTNAPVVKARPDYKWNPYPTYFPTKYIYPNCFNNPGWGWANPYPIPPLEAKHSMMISTFNWIPINGDFDNQQLGEKILSWPEYDSEPDIFSANFLGHSLRFMRDFNGGNIVVLNKKGYKVTRTGEDFNIITPSGDQYFFEIKSAIIANVTTTGGLLNNNSANYEPNSRIWMLSKIITKNKKQIVFNYFQSATVNNYPPYSEKFDKLTLPTSNVYNLLNNPWQPNVEGFNDLAYGATEVAATYYQSTENRLFLNSITFPNGQVSFTLSDRNDIIGGKKIDAIQINSDQLIKSYQFNYSYFDASAVGGNTPGPPGNAAIFGNMPNLRLKLLSIQDNVGVFHTFAYNSTPLPSKNSFAQDFWGFYNGQLSNTTLVPNPARLKISALVDNGNNNSANLTYAQAAMLTEIQYPTGGKNTFEYELNQFDNYWAPDFNDINNQTSNGNGLRIHTINYLTASSVISKKTVYNYYGGKSIVPFDVYRTFNVNSNHLNSSQELWSTNYVIHELNGKGFFSSNSLGSINGIGYDKVVKSDIDGNGITNGRIETLFNNTPDKFYYTGNVNGLGVALPTRKDVDNPENGTVKTIFIYTKDNSLLRKVENTYTTGGSSLYYGARVFGYSSLFYPVGNCLGGGNATWGILPQNLIGYYPIYDIESLLQQAVTTDYDANNNAISSTTIYSYNLYRQLNDHILITSTKPNQHGQLITKYTYPIDIYVNTGVYGPLLAANMLTEVTNAKKTSVTGSISYYPRFSDYDKVDNEYIVLGDKVVKSTTTITEHPGSNALPSVITYNLYDPTNANLLEYTEKGITNSLLWDYNSEYVTAEVSNSSFQNVAATSFESNGTGSWNYSGTVVSDNTAPTGQKVYTLTGNNVTKSGLDASKTFVVSYWSKNGPQSVNGTTGISGRSLNGWTYYEHSVSNPGGGIVTVAGSGVIDELRLYPLSALMSTYTYAPLIGMKTLCDANNKIRYYEYDASNRLTLIIDQDKNILKKICYNYAGQPDNCSSNTPPPCTQNCVNLTSTMTIGYSGYTASYFNTATGDTYNFTVSTSSGLQLLGTVPEGNYTLTISRTSGGTPPYGIFKSGCWRHTISGTSAVFYNVAVSTSTCNSILLDFLVN